MKHSSIMMPRVSTLGLAVILLQVTSGSNQGFSDRRDDCKYLHTHGGLNRGGRWGGRPPNLSIGGGGGGGGASPPNCRL